LKLQVKRLRSVTEISGAADTRWLSDTELAAWIPFSGMLIGHRPDSVGRSG